MIKVENLVKTYGATRAVDDVSFDLNKGEVVGFLGPNGAGKTTTLRVMTCYLTADSGSVFVDGFDTSESPISVREKVGYLPENNPLYSEMDVVDYLDYVGRIRKLSGAKRKERIGEVLDMCSLGDVRWKNISQLSKGYRQRVGLAQALVHDPKFLILDEPTSGLDPTQIIEIRKLIRNIGKEKAIILSTHILPEVEATCDRVIIINKGKIVLESSVKDLSTRASSGKVVYVAVMGPEKEVGAALGGLSEGAKVSVKGKISQGHARYAVSGLDEGTSGEKLFDLAVSKGWKLTELTEEKTSLEDIFLSLTTSDSAKKH